MVHNRVQRAKKGDVYRERRYCVNGEEQDKAEMRILRGLAEHDLSDVQRRVMGTDRKKTAGPFTCMVSVGKGLSFLCYALSLLFAFQQNNGDLACDRRNKRS